MVKPVIKHSRTFIAIANADVNNISMSDTHGKSKQLHELQSH